MSITDIVIILGVAAVFIGIVVYLARRKNKASCGSDCTKCGLDCPAKKEDKS